MSYRASPASKESPIWRRIFRTYPFLGARNSFRSPSTSTSKIVPALRSTRLPFDAAISSNTPASSAKTMRVSGKGGTTDCEFIDWLGLSAADRIQTTGKSAKITAMTRIAIWIAKPSVIAGRALPRLSLTWLDIFGCLLSSLWSGGIAPA